MSIPAGVGNKKIKSHRKNLNLCNMKEDVDILISQTEGLSIQSQQVRRAVMTRYRPCCGSGAGIRCFFDPWIRDPR
jgi:hypothetical protein